MAIQTADPVDDLGDAVLLGLSRPIGWRQAPRPLRTLATGFCTFGYFPILEWQLLLRQFTTLEQQQFWHAAEWLRRSGNEVDGQALLRSADRVHPPRIARGLIMVAVLASLGCLCYRIHSLKALAANTYLFPFSNTFSAEGRRWSIYLGWFASLAIAYSLHLWQVNIYDRRAARFVREFMTRLGPRELRLPPTIFHPNDTNLSGPRWQLLWAMFPVGPFVARAGSGQATVVRVSSRVRRARLSMRLRIHMLELRPAADLAVPIYLRRQCRNELCANPLADEAHFCPRCGLEV